MGMFVSPLFSPAPLPSGGPVDPFMPVGVPVYTGGDTTGGLLQTILSGIFAGAGPVSVPIPGFQPISPISFTPAPQAPVVTMPSPVSMTGRCLLRRHRRINWCNPRALRRANSRLQSFNRHARKYIKITRKIKSRKRSRR